MISSTRAAIVLVTTACTPAPSGGRPAEDRPASVDSANPTTLPAATEHKPPNVLVVVLDDIGVDGLARYGSSLPNDFPSTPTIDRLADEGVLFRNAYAMPYCSPTRATVLTGQLPRNTGIGAAIQLEDVVHLPYEETTLPELLQQADPPYASVALGKWHLGTVSSGYGADPLEHGFQSHRGSVFNFTEPSLDARNTDYWDWEKNLDGTLVWMEDRYATTDTINDAIHQVGALPEPWFLWVALNAPHAPYHNPPAELLSAAAPSPDPGPQWRAMIEAADTELGRLLDATDPEVLARTTVIVVGDNGSPDDAATWLPVGNRKGSVHEGGIRVPLIIRSPVVAQPGAETSALVSVADLFGTIADLASVPGWEVHGVDSVSLVPHLVDPQRSSLRTSVYSERFSPNGPGPYERFHRGLRDERWKLYVVNDSETEIVEFHDLSEDENGLDVHDLLADGPLAPEAQAAYDRLRSILDSQYPLPSML